MFRLSGIGAGRSDKHGMFGREAVLMLAEWAWRRRQNSLDLVEVAVKGLYCRWMDANKTSRRKRKKNMEKMLVVRRNMSDN